MPDYKIEIGIPTYIILIRVCVIILLVAILLPGNSFNYKTILLFSLLLCVIIGNSYKCIILTQEHINISTRRILGKNTKFTYPLRSIGDLEFKPQRLIPFLQLNILDLYLTIEGHRGRIHHRIVGSSSKMRTLINTYNSMKNSVQ